MTIMELRNRAKRLLVKVEWQGWKKEHHAGDLAEALSWMKMYPIGASVQVVSKWSDKVIMER